MLDIILIVTVALFFLRGSSRGLLAQALVAARVIASAAAAYLYYKSGGNILFVGFVFIAASLVLKVVFWALKKILLKKDRRLTLISRACGGAIGGLEGALYACVFVVLLYFLNGVLGTLNPRLAVGLEKSFFYSLCKKAVSHEVSAAAPGPSAYQPGRRPEEIAGKIFANEETTGVFMNNPSIKAVMEDEALVNSIQQKDYVKVMSNPKFLKIFNDRELIKELSAVVSGKVSPAAGIKQELEQDTKAIQSSKPKKEPARGLTANRLEGVVYINGAAAAVINNEIYMVGAEISGAKIIKIGREKVLLQFPDGQKEYSTGDVIP